ncbi:hypothetical protein COU13_00415 [Candidatus Kaiserbacteria bacterium CG10_big_fil_rev_8_21_14_0_10_43_70]|uniref:Uncharacterized protein n=1 Tax=Candidatus Kaiserbacteria bacterium CG10_big_fil_rev_8_21_14_0_10_43_70 TaxID=1974605 RepID=A0A2H0UJE8_9BACT|nr:MAG: hypothetical protein COU13_00415 [Candidatus Kaiserbacteria bacterium CG10_big_fil_rev_8_21_14_0_10_43_70]
MSDIGGMIRLGKRVFNKRENEMANKEVKMYCEHCGFACTFHHENGVMCTFCKNAMVVFDSSKHEQKGKLAWAKGLEKNGTGEVGSLSLLVDESGSDAKGKAEAPEGHSATLLDHTR